MTSSSNIRLSKSIPFPRTCGFLARTLAEILSLKNTSTKSRTTSVSRNIQTNPITTIRTTSSIFITMALIIMESFPISRRTANVINPIITHLNPNVRPKTSSIINKIEDTSDKYVETSNVETKGKTTISAINTVLPILATSCINHPNTSLLPLLITAFFSSSRSMTRIIRIPTNKSYKRIFTIHPFLTR